MDNIMEEEMVQSKRKKIEGEEGHKFVNDDKHNVVLNDTSYNSEAVKDIKILDLPKEVLSSLLRWVPQREKVYSRLVCKEWKQNVDHLATFNVKLTENIPPDLLRRVLELRITSIEFSSIQKNDFELNLTFPLLVKEIIISTNVSPTNFQKICATCRDVQVLRFLSTFNSDKTFNPASREESLEMLRNLKRLKEIEIGIISFGIRRLWECETFNVIFSNDLALPFKGLCSLNITLQLYHSEMFKFFEFLVKQSVTLKHLNVRLECPRNNDNSDYMLFVEAPWYSKLIKNLEFTSLTVMRDPSSCSFCIQQVEPIWRSIIQSQSSLKHLEVDLRKDFSIQELVHVITSNPNLSILKVYGIFCDIGDGDILDVVFKNSKLVELFLEFTGSTLLIVSGVSGESHKQQFEFKAIEYLPSTLKRLTIKKCLVRHENLFNGLKNRLKTLQELHLEDCLFPNETKVDINVFLELFKIFGSDENDIQRFTFDGFQVYPTIKTTTNTDDEQIKKQEKEAILWNNIIRISKSIGILQDRNIPIPLLDQSCRFIGYGEKEELDFVFSKQQVKEFIHQIENSCHD